MASAKDDPIPVKVETSDEGILLQETVPVGERDGFGTSLDSSLPQGISVLLLHVLSK